MASVSQAIRATLLTGEPRAKVMATRALVRAWRGGALEWDFAAAMPDRPAWPAELELLPPNRMPTKWQCRSSVLKARNTRSAKC